MGLTYYWARLFGRPAFYILHEKMYILALRGMGVFNVPHGVTGESHFLRHRLPRLLAPTDLIVDVGAHNGAYALEAREICSNPILAIEPHPRTYERLQHNVAGRDIETLNLALGDSERSASFFDHDENGSEHASLYNDVQGLFYDAAHVHEYRVQVRTLDDVVPPDATVGLLKIDTEGNELECLRGASRLLSERRIKCIQFEFNELNVVSRVFLRDFFDLLPGWSFYRLLPHGWRRIEYDTYYELFKFQNFVALPPANMR